MCRSSHAFRTLHGRHMHIHMMQVVHLCLLFALVHRVDTETDGTDLSSAWRVMDRKSRTCTQSIAGPARRVYGLTSMPYRILMRSCLLGYSSQHAQRNAVGC